MDGVDPIYNLGMGTMQTMFIRQKQRFKGNLHKEFESRVLEAEGVYKHLLTLDVPQAP